MSYTSISGITNEGIDEISEFVGQYADLNESKEFTETNNTFMSEFMVQPTGSDGASSGFLVPQTEKNMELLKQLTERVVAVQAYMNRMKKRDCKGGSGVNSHKNKNNKDDDGSGDGSAGGSSGPKSSGGFTRANVSALFGSDNF